MRKYDLEEIDRMRVAVGVIISYSNQVANGEDRLRTYMMNGTDPEELEKYAELIKEKFDLSRRIYEAEKLLKQHTCEHEWHYTETISANGKRERACSKCQKFEWVAK